MRLRARRRAGRGSPRRGGRGRALRVPGALRGRREARRADGAGAAAGCGLAAAGEPDDGRRAVPRRRLRPDVLRVVVSAEALLPAEPPRAGRAGRARRAERASDRRRTRAARGGVSARPARRGGDAPDDHGRRPLPALRERVPEDRRKLLRARARRLLRRPHFPSRPQPCANRLSRRSSCAPPNSTGRRAHRSSNPS